MDWAFVQQAAALSASAQLVRGRWWRVAAIAFVLLLRPAVGGPSSASSSSS